MKPLVVHPVREVPLDQEMVDRLERFRHAAGDAVADWPDEVLIEFALILATDRVKRSSHVLRR